MLLTDESSGCRNIKRDLRLKKKKKEEEKMRYIERYHRFTKKK